jgi:hypothetical protein
VTPVGDDEQGTCETLVTTRAASGEALQSLRFCGKPAALRYPAMGGGFMRMCERHGATHAGYCERWNDARGWSR